MYTESQQYARLPQVDVLRTKSLCIVNATPYILHCLIHLCIFVWHNVLIIVLLKSKWNTLQSLFKKKIGQNSWLIVVAKWHKRQKHITQSLHVAITALLIKKPFCWFTMKMQLLLCTAKIKCQLTHQCSFTLCFCFGGVLIYKNYCYCPEYVPQFFTRVESLLPTLSVDICFKQLISKSYVCLICMTYDVCLSQLLEESHDNFPQLDRFYKETAIKIQ